MIFDNKTDEYFISIAKDIAKKSTAIRAKVGAALVKDKNLLAVGYNRNINGDSCCEDVTEDGSLVTKKTVIHAEINVLTYCAKNGISTADTKMYLTLSPCACCATAMINAGIEEVIYATDYVDLTGLDILKENGIKVTKL